MKFQLKSPGIVNGIIADKYGKHAGNDIHNIPQTSIPLQWEGAPDTTKSFVLICMDYDNYEEDGYAWLHWSVANIPAEITGLPEGCSCNIQKIDSRIIQGKTTWISKLDPDCPECNRYGGPAPEVRSHEYEFRLYALKDFLKLNNGYYHNHLRKSIQDMILDETALWGIYII